jgi:hypothetical protein
MGQVLTMLQPWASLTALGHKTLETRKFQPPQGKLWIHASKSPRGIQWLRQNPALEAYIVSLLGPLHELPMQHVVGSVSVLGSRPLTESDKLQGPAFGYLIDADIVWEFEGACTCKPLRLSGKLGIWHSDQLD